MTKKETFSINELPKTYQGYSQTVVMQ